MPKVASMRVSGTFRQWVRYTRSRVRVADDMATPGGGGGRLRILSARVSAALGSGALGLALAGGLARLLATGTAASPPEAATP